MASSTQVSGSLSTADQLTMSRLFDPEASPTHAAPLIDASLPASPHYPSEVLESLKSEEKRAIQLAEASQLPEALSVLTTLLTSHPQYASAYNNRAQVHRLLHSPVSEVLADLTAAIEHASPSTPLAPVSKENAKVLAQAYTQRGAVLLDRFRKDGREEDEEGASRDFAVGGRYGNEMARALAVKTNPYARLCGAIVKEALRKEVEEGEVW